MSEALFGFGGLRFWHENEIELREQFTARAISVVKRELFKINPAWQFARMEGPCLIPLNQISNAFSDKDIFGTNHMVSGEPIALRAETTQSSYLYANMLRSEGKKLPLCVYQSGKSFRRELNDGATAKKMRFNEFHQLEFQCIYSDTTKATYRDPLMRAMEVEINRFAVVPTRQTTSDRLPSYSESTIDIEALDGEDWREMASCSIRTDFAPNTKVCEIAIGLDRVATLAARK
jgi:glycyl-tRNA synthetase